MAFLFVESLAENKSRFVQVLGKILELILLSIGLFSSVMVMKNRIDLPYSCQFVFSSFMGFLNFIKCSFLSSPLTIIITINLMVLLIFASSAFHRRPAADHLHDHHLQIIISHHESPPAPAPAPPPWDIVQVTTTPPPTPSPSPSPSPSTTTIIPIKNNTTTTTTTTTTLQSLFSNQDLTFTPPSPSAPPLEKYWKDVYIEKEDEETMEATWEAISGGVKRKQKKNKKHINKSDTWDAPPPRRLDSEEVVPSSPKWQELRKAETFNDAVSLTRRGGLIRRDSSMSIEEFNQKVDNFIKNFNDNIRLQRQQSIINQKRRF